LKGVITIKYKKVVHRTGSLCYILFKQPIQSHGCVNNGNENQKDG